MDKKVNIWEEDIILPTYAAGEPEKNPMFLEKRVYQGSSGVVYPYPVIEKIEDECEDKPYHAVFLENEYIKVMILPELGGRVQMAYDKIKQRHFIYYNHVVKPALVGLTGPWISGGIEFNWPQHHRPSTFLPIDFTTEECEDGSAIVWVHERERMFHQEALAGFKLSPGRAVLEIKGKLYNPTPTPQTFLWWANPAVSVNDHYQSVFPGDVNAVFDHGKRDVSTYPIATGTYYKVDYSAGVDISRYKNIPVPTSYMAIKSKFDFVGGYENDTRAGLLHVANHHISPGKKQWTWGNGDFGQAWDRNLTDSDGPYIELMTGVYTDNQPDFSWIQPYEEKAFTQYFMPYRELGVVKNASADLLMNLEEEDGKWLLKLFATSRLEDVRICVEQKGKACYEKTASLSPEEVFIDKVPFKTLQNIKVTIRSKTGKSLLSWETGPEESKPVPEPAKAALAPADVPTTEQLYLTGLHLEQYRHATYNPADYYVEALRRDPGDVRNNNAMGLLLLRKGQFDKAEPYFRKAIETLTERNPNPYDGEPFYNLGLALKYQEKYDEAYESFYKACWNAAWQASGYFSLAQISCIRQDWQAALEEIDQALVRNWHNHRARHLKVVILSFLDRHSEALELIEESLKINKFNFGCLFEKSVLSNKEADLTCFKQLMRDEPHNYLELTTDYISAGLWGSAGTLLALTMPDIQRKDKLLYYYQAWCLANLKNKHLALMSIQMAESGDVGCCFPNRLEDIAALEKAVVLAETEAPRALYLLGNLWYDKRNYKRAIFCWEKSIERDDQFPTVKRNLALAYFNKLDKKEEAVRLLEEAFALDTSDARLLMELDQLYKCLNRPHATRLAFLDKYKETAWQRDDLYLEYATLLNQLGRHEEAIHLIDTRKFHPWEGGEGKVPAQYQLARMELAKRQLEEGRPEEALRLIDECYTYPHNLGEGKLPGAKENDFDYYKGLALEALGRNAEAAACYEKATQGSSEPSPAIYYNDQKPDKIFYQGLAFRKTGHEEEARSRFGKLVAYGEKHLADTFKMDYFAVSLPDLQIWEDDMDKKNRVYCLYLMALGYCGLNDKERAFSCFSEAAQSDNNHQGVQTHQQLLINTVI